MPAFDVVLYRSSTNVISRLVSCANYCALINPQDDMESGTTRPMRAFNILEKRHMRENRCVLRKVYCCLLCRVPKFHPFRTIIRPFRNILDFGIFPLTPMLKFQSALFLKLGRLTKISQKSNILYSPTVTNTITKLTSDE